MALSVNSNSWSTTHPIFFPGLTEEDNREKGKLYKPQAKHEDKNTDKVSELAKFQSTTSSSVSKKDAASKKNKTQEKKKSNLELFKEELRK